jgi:hypothetical protein
VLQHLLALLPGNGLGGSDGCCMVVLGGQALGDFLFDNVGGSVCLFMEIKGISGNSWLASLDSLFCSLEMGLEVRPDFVVFSFIMPFANVVG